MVSLNCQNNSFSINSPPPLPVFLGFPGENGTRPVQIDVSAWLDEFPEGAVSIVYTRADKLTYVVVVNAIGPVVTWEPERRDLVTGACQIQVQIQQGDAVKKNHIVDCVVGKALDDPNDPPEEPQPSYVEDVIDAADRAEAAVEHYPQIRNGYWWVWDVESGEWVNTGVKATGEGGGAVDSVNGKTGVVVLDAEDVGALPDSTVIPPTVTEQTVAGWGFTKNTGTYSKPSGGIPKSDLASGVQTSLGKADTALQTAPVSSVNNKTGVVSLNASDVGATPEPLEIPVTESGGTYSTTATAAQIRAAKENSVFVFDGEARIKALLWFQPEEGLDLLIGTQFLYGIFVVAATVTTNNVAITVEQIVIPTDTSDLTNDAGYITENGVKTAPIDDTDGYYTTDTVEGALQEIGAELSGINTLIGSGVIT